MISLEKQLTNYNNIIIDKRHYFEISTKLCKYKRGDLLIRPDHINNWKDKYILILGFIVNLERDHHKYLCKISNSSHPTINSKHLITTESVKYLKDYTLSLKTKLSKL